MTSSWSKERFKSDKILKFLKNFLKNFDIFMGNFLIAWKIFSFFGKFEKILHFFENFAFFGKFCIFWKILKKFAFLRIWKKFAIFKIFAFFGKNFFKILSCLKCSVLVFCGTLSEILNFFRVFSLLFFTLSEWFLHVICYNEVFMVKRAF